jgi:hypothetical protein
MENLEPPSSQEHTILCHDLIPTFDPWDPNDLANLYLD